MNSRPSFLFDPVEVAKLLDGLPHLRAAIPDPAQEGDRLLHRPRLYAADDPTDTCTERLGERTIFQRF